MKPRKALCWKKSKYWWLVSCLSRLTAVFSADVKKMKQGKLVFQTRSGLIKNPWITPNEFSKHFPLIRESMFQKTFQGKWKEDAHNAPLWTTPILEFFLPGQKTKLRSFFSFVSKLILKEEKKKRKHKLIKILYFKILLANF